VQKGQIAGEHSGWETIQTGKTVKGIRQKAILG